MTVPSVALTHGPPGRREHEGHLRYDVDLGIWTGRGCVAHGRPREDSLSLDEVLVDESVVVGVNADWHDCAVALPRAVLNDEGLVS